jgi:hypothetical protein
MLAAVGRGYLVLDLAAGLERQEAMAKPLGMNTGFKSAADRRTPAH